MNEGAPKFESKKKYLSDRETKEFEEEENSEIDLSKRNFIKGAVAGVVAVAAPNIGNEERSKVSQSAAEQPEAKKQTLEPDEAQAEKDPKGKDIAEQLEEFGEVIDVNAAVEAMYSDHYTELVETADGRKRIADIAARVDQHDIATLVEEFNKRGLESWLAVGLPAHESDWLDRTSSRGALGTHQLMPQTVKVLGERLGYENPDPHDVYQSNEMAAEYLSDERKRFGDDVYMQLYAYVAGIRLTGFTDQENDRNKWNRKHLYAFIAERFNQTYKELKDEGFIFSKEPVHVEHIIESGDTMWSISKRYGVDLDLIAEANDIEDPNVIKAGERIRIPYKNNLEKALRERNWDTFHMLEYAPHFIAMYDALASQGYVVARKEEDDQFEVAAADQR